MNAIKKEPGFSEGECSGVEALDLRDVSRKVKTPTLVELFGLLEPGEGLELTDYREPVELRDRLRECFGAEVIWKVVHGGDSNCTVWLWRRWTRGGPMS